LGVRISTYKFGLGWGHSSINIMEYYSAIKGRKAAMDYNMDAP
jgi:hypothetical protein